MEEDSILKRLWYLRRYIVAQAFVVAMVFAFIHFAISMMYRSSTNMHWIDMIVDVVFFYFVRIYLKSYLIKNQYGREITFLYDETQFYGGALFVFIFIVGICLGPYLKNANAFGVIFLFFMFVVAPWFWISCLAKLISWILNFGFRGLMTYSLLESLAEKDRKNELGVIETVIAFNVLSEFNESVAYSPNFSLESTTPKIEQYVNSNPEVIQELNDKWAKKTNLMFVFVILMVIGLHLFIPAISKHSVKPNNLQPIKVVQEELSPKEVKHENNVRNFQNDSSNKKLKEKKQQLFNVNITENAKYVANANKKLKNMLDGYRSSNKDKVYAYAEKAYKYALSMLGKSSNPKTKNERKLKEHYQNMCNSLLSAASQAMRQMEKRTKPKFQRAYTYIGICDTEYKKLFMEIE